MNFDAAVFDLDGTLIDSVHDVGAAVNRLLRDRCRPTLSAQALEKMVGHGPRPLLTKAFAATGAELREDEVPEAIQGYLEFYRSDPVSRTLIYPGVVEVLTKLRADGLKMGLCTNKPYEVTLLVVEQLELGRFFDAVTGGNNVPHPKPDGRHIHLTLEQMSARDCEAVMIGDSETDMAAARDAGLPSVAVDWGYRRGAPEDLDADVLIGDFHDLPAALDELSRRRMVVGE